MLIQKDVKQLSVYGQTLGCLRALLIQKDVKQGKKDMNLKSV